MVFPPAHPRFFRASEHVFLPRTDVFYAFRFLFQRRTILRNSESQLRTSRSADGGQDHYVLQRLQLLSLTKLQGFDIQLIRLDRTHRTHARTAIRVNNTTVLCTLHDSVNDQ